jgi:hypothetical protein
MNLNLISDNKKATDKKSRVFRLFLFSSERRTKEKLLSSIEADWESNFNRNTGSCEHYENEVFGSVKQTISGLISRGFVAESWFRVLPRGLIPLI